MKILIDLQACQGESRFRGIGSYSMSLALEIAKQAPERGHSVGLLLNASFPETIIAIRKLFSGVIQHENIFIFTVPGATSEIEQSNTWRSKAAELVRELYIASLHPDIIHISSLFEGWVDGVITSVNKSNRDIQTSVTLYDLIPMALSELYLVDPRYRNQYLRKLENLKRSDLLLAISEYSRSEVIKLLGFDSKSVFNISGAVHESFQKKDYKNDVKKKILNSYGIKKTFLLYVPGGFDPRKNFKRLIEAFAKLPFNLRQNYQLVIASKLPSTGNEYFTDLATQAGLEDSELLLTGYVSNDDLIALYNFCKVFVFPSLHEGFGLPVLEAMACGAAVIGSNSTSIPDVLGREDALFDPLSVTSISSMLKKVLTDESFEKSLREHSLLQAKKFSWENSARLAIDAFELIFKKNTLHKLNMKEKSPIDDNSINSILEDLNNSNLSCSPTSEDLDLLRRSISRNQTKVNEKQLLVDISELVKRDSKSGIQRVVRSILLNLLKNPPFGYRVEPIYSEKGNGFIYARNFTSGFIGSTPDLASDSPVSFCKGDVFLGLDLSAGLFPALNTTLKQMQETGVKINYVIYDLIPLLHSWHGPEMKAVFTCWMDALTLFADNLVCISDAVANDVKQWIIEHSVDRKGQLMVHSFHLGADIANSLPSVGLPENYQVILECLRKNPSFLMVGTIEPRKGHLQTLEAFEYLWATDNEVNLVIVGKPGWHLDSLITRLRSHPELNNRLYFLERISDEFLEKIYQSCAALIFASEAEGFGLPLIEAAKHSLPLILRNLPVFKELAGEYAFYFDGLYSSDLANALKSWLKLSLDHSEPKSTLMPWLTWEQSTQKMIDCFLFEK